MWWHALSTLVCWQHVKPSLTSSDLAASSLQGRSELMLHSEHDYASSCRHTRNLGALHELFAACWSLATKGLHASSRPDAVGAPNGQNVLLLLTSASQSENLWWDKQHEHWWIFGVFFQTFSTYQMCFFSVFGNAFYDVQQFSTVFSWKFSRCALVFPNFPDDWNPR